MAQQTIQQPMGDKSSQMQPTNTMDQPMEEIPKKKNYLFWIILLAIIVVGAGVWYFFLR